MEHTTGACAVKVAETNRATWWSQALSSQDVGRWAVVDAVVVCGGTANSCSGWSRSPQSNGNVEERSNLRPGKSGESDRGREGGATGSG